MNPLPGFSNAITQQQEAAAAQRGRELSDRMREPGKHIDRATGYLESHTPLFAGTAADPQRSLFTHDDPTY